MSNTKDEQSVEHTDSAELDEGLQKLFEEHVPKESAKSPESQSSLPEISPKNYTVDKEIGQGELGRVIRALDKRLKRTVAIKELLSDQRETRARFLREARITAQLQHPGIVPIYEVGCWPSGEPFYTMKLVSGTPLAELIPERAELDARLSLLPNLLAAIETIAYAHSHKIIHRALTPNHILVGDFGETLVVDWGLARLLAESNEETERQSNTSDPEKKTANSLDGLANNVSVYMPPEQAEDRPLDERADVYSLGAILYHLLAAQPPYPEKSHDELPQQIVQHEPTPLQTMQKGVPSSLALIVGRAMSKEVSRRYPDAKSLAEALKRFMQGQLIGAHQYSTKEKLFRFFSQHTLASLLGVIALFAVGAFAVTSLRDVLHAKDDAVEKQLSESNARKQATLRADTLILEQAKSLATKDPKRALSLLAALSDDFSDWSTARLIAADANRREPTILSFKKEARAGVPVQLLFSPDSRWLALATSAEAGAPGDVWLWELSSQRAKRFSIDVSYGLGVVQSRHMQFSPESSTLAIASLDKKVHLLKLSDQTEQTLTINIEAEVLAFSPDGAQLAIGGAEGTLLLWDVASNTPTSSFQQNNTGVVDVAFSPDGAFVAASTRGDTLTSSAAASEILLLSRKTGALTHLRGHTLPAIGLTFSPDSQRLFSCGIDHTVQQWTLKDGARSELSIPGQCNWIALSANGEHLAASGAFASMLLWDVKTKAPQLLRGHLIATAEIHFSSSGETLLSTSPDTTVRLWDLKTLESHIIGRHHDQTLLAAFSPDQRYIASASVDGEVRLWPDDLPQDAVALRAWLQRINQ